MLMIFIGRASYNLLRNKVIYQSLFP